jgi:hypothetical protein
MRSQINSRFIWDRLASPREAIEGFHQYIEIASANGSTVQYIEKRYIFRRLLRLLNSLFVTPVK